MNCDAIAAKIPDLVAGRLAQEERIAVEAALSQCPHCVEFRRQVEAFYALDLDSSLPLRPVPMPPLPEHHPFMIRRAAAAAAALVLVLLSWWAFQNNNQEEQQLAQLEPLAVVLPELPAHSGDGLWTVGDREARLLSAYTGKPLATTYLFPYCPRCESMMEDLDRVEVHDLLSDFVHQKVVFTENLPEALRVRQHEVESTMYIHTPVLIISAAGVDEEALYDISSLEMIAARVARFQNERQGQVKKPLDQDRFAEYQQIITQLPEQLAEGQWGLALKNLRQGLAGQDQYQSQFFAEFRTLESAILKQIDARIDGAAEELKSGAAATARARLRAMQLALDGEGPTATIERLLAD